MAIFRKPGKDRPFAVADNGFQTVVTSVSRKNRGGRGAETAEDDADDPVTMALERHHRYKDEVPVAEQVEELCGELEREKLEKWANQRSGT